MEAGQFIKRRRQELGLTQQTLSDRLAAYGFASSHSRVGHWETGRNEPPIDDRAFRVALASALEMSLNQMLHELGYEVSDDQRSTEALIAAGIIERLPPPVQRVALEQLRALEKQFSTS
jgi:transcriptional regulator with XRE-family HTH domain